MDVEAPNIAERNEVQYPRSFELAAIVTSVSLATFLVALDQTIITTAIPKITDQFHSLNDIGWYGSGYMLTMCSFPLVFGRLYITFDKRLCFLVSIVIFEIGSLICGVAPISEVFILGRAFAGLGASGISTGTLYVLQDSVPPRKIPKYNVLPIAIWAIAGGVGPVIGGAMTDHASWRWCFYINLPMGALVALVLARYFISRPTVGPWGGVLKELPGPILFTTGVACLLISLQWGGQVHPWHSATIIVLLIFFVLLLVVFMIIQVLPGNMVTIPPRILRQRTVAFGSLIALSNGSCYTVLTFYLPVWFQVVKDASATHSGAMTLPLVLGVSFSSIAGGFATSKFRRYIPIMFLGAALCVVGTTLLTRLQANTGFGRSLAYQAICGIGIGLIMQVPITATQALLTKDDSVLGVAIITFFRLIGGICFNSACQSILTQTLARRLDEAFPNFDTTTTKVPIGVTSLKDIFSAEELVMVIKIYNDALRDCFYVPVAMAALQFVACFGMDLGGVVPR